MSPKGSINRRNPSQIRVIDFSPIRPNIAVAGGGEEVKLIEFGAEIDSNEVTFPTQLRHVIGSNPMPRKFIVSAAAFSPFSEKEIAIGTLTGHVVVFDISQSMKLEKAKYAYIDKGSNNDKRKVYSLDWGFHKDSTTIYVVTSDGQLNVHILVENKKIPFSGIYSKPNLSHKSSKSVVSGHHSSKTLAIGYVDGAIEIFSSDNSGQIAFVKVLQHPKKTSINCVKWLSQNVIVVSSDHQDILVFNLEEGRIVGKLTGHRKRVTSLSVSTASNQVISASCDESSVHVYRLNLDMKICKTFNPSIIKDHQMRVFAVSFAPFNCNVVVSGGADGDIHVWKLDEQPIATDEQISLLCGSQESTSSSDIPWTDVEQFNAGEEITYKNIKVSEIIKRLRFNSKIPIIEKARIFETETPKNVQRTSVEIKTDENSMMVEEQNLLYQ